jgi:hypothetical protein
VHEYLARCRGSDPVATAISDLLQTMKAAPAGGPSRLVRLRRALSEHYEAVVEHPLFRAALVVFFGVHALLSVGNALLLAGAAVSLMTDFDLPYGGMDHASFAELGTLISSVVSGAFVIAGIVMLRRSRMRAYQLFKIAVVISLLLTEFFVFLQVQFQAIWGFALNVAILLALDTLIDEERELRAARHAQTLAPGTSHPVLAGR